MVAVVIAAVCGHRSNASMCDALVQVPSICVGSAVSYCQENCYHHFSLLIIASHCFPVQSHPTIQVVEFRIVIIIIIIVIIIIVTIIIVIMIIII